MKEKFEKAGYMALYYKIETSDKPIVSGKEVLNWIITNSWTAEHQKVYGSVYHFSEVQCIFYWLSEPLWCGGCLDKWIVWITEISLNASMNNTITYTSFVLLVLALAWLLWVWRKPVTYTWLKYRSHYKMATIL